MMKNLNKFNLIIIAIFFSCLINSCTEFDYPPVDQLQIINKQFLNVCDTMINIANKLNREKQYDNDLVINSFIIQVGKINCDTSFEFVFDNCSSIGYAIHDEFKIFGYFYYKNYTFLVQYHINPIVPNIFRKTGYQNKITFVKYSHKSFLKDLFENKHEIVIVPNYDPKYRSFRYVNGEFLMYEK